MSDGDHRTELPGRPIEGDVAFDQCALRRRCCKRRGCPKDTGEMSAGYARVESVVKVSRSPSRAFIDGHHASACLATARSRRQCPTPRATPPPSLRSGIDGDEHSGTLNAVMAGRNRTRRKKVRVQVPVHRHVDDACDERPHGARQDTTTNALGSSSERGQTNDGVSDP
jgi:hypothetical protein